MRSYYFFLLWFIFIPEIVFSRTISPVDYGLNNALIGEERFWALYKTHTVAKEKGWKVSYKGITQIELDIPSNAKTIPLSYKTDFCKASIIVTNTKKKNFFLFELSQEVYPISVPKNLFGTYDFRGIEELKRGNRLLIIEDLNPWVENRAGYNYGAIRRDILLLKDGKSINMTVAPYNNATSIPKCSYTTVSRKRKDIKSIVFIRTSESSFKTFLMRVMNVDNVLIQGVSIVTSKPITMDGDRAIAVENCTNVVFKNINIDQTYSYDNHYGYGILMNNVWNSRFDNIVCDASWGVFGNNNINTVNVSNSRINRFDTHCYGRDFKFRNCELSEYGLTQSSFFGALEFEKCTFKTAIVCFCRTDYNAFTPFTIKLSNCTIYLDKSHSYLIRLGNVIEGANSRQELQTKYTPGVTLINSTIVLTEDLPYWSIFLLKNQSSEKPFDYLGKILIDGVQVEENETDLAVFDRPIRCDNPVCIDINRLNLFVRNIDSIKRPLVSRRPTILFNINQDGTDVFHISNSQLNYNSIDIPTSRLVSNNSN